MPTQRILVTLATGNQGSALVRALSKQNQQSSNASPYTILAVTRNSTSAKAKKLAALPGVELIESDYEVKSIFDKATKGGKAVDGVFAVQGFLNLPKHVSKGPEGEKELGIQLIDEAKRRNVRHFVYTSVDAGGLPQTDVPHFESKRLIEEHLKQVGGLPWTILRPVGFMDNFSNGEDMLGRINNTFFAKVLTKPIKLIAASDIGEIAAVVFEKPEEYVGKTISIAGDEVTPKQIQDTYELVKGRPLTLTYSVFPFLVRLLSKELRNMFNFFNVHGFEASIEDTRAMYPQAKSFRQYVETEM